MEDVSQPADNNKIIVIEDEVKQAVANAEDQMDIVNDKEAPPAKIEISLQEANAITDACKLSTLSSQAVTDLAKTIELLSLSSDIGVEVVDLAIRLKSYQRQIPAITKNYTTNTLEEGRYRIIAVDKYVTEAYSAQESRQDDIAQSLHPSVPQTVQPNSVDPLRITTVMGVTEKEFQKIWSERGAPLKTATLNSDGTWERQVPQSPWSLNSSNYVSEKLSLCLNYGKYRHKTSDHGRVHYLGADIIIPYYEGKKLANARGQFDGEQQVEKPISQSQPEELPFDEEAAKALIKRFLPGTNVHRYSIDDNYTPHAERHELTPDEIRHAMLGLVNIFNILRDPSQDAQDETLTFKLKETKRLIESGHVFKHRINSKGKLLYHNDKETDLKIETVWHVSVTPPSNIDVIKTW